MKKGEKSLLTVKPQYAFGENGCEPASGNDCVVPPNTTLLITLELVSWKIIVSEVTTDNKVSKKILKEGEGYDLVVTDQRPVNEAPQVSQLGMVKIPSTNNVENNSVDQEVSQPNRSMGEVEPQSQPSAHAHAPEADILGDLLAIEGPPGISGIRGLSEGDALALAPVGEQENGVKPIGDIAERFYALCLMP